MATVKCVVVGDSDAEKTALLCSYTTSNKVSEYIPTVFDDYPVNVLFQNEPYLLSLHDTTGQHDYDRLRPLTYPNTDVFLVCFSVVSPSSFESVKQKWIPEIKQHCRKTPFVLVGTQIHLRNDSSTLERLVERKLKPITLEEGEKLAKKLKAFKYVECSAFTSEGVKNVFDVALEATL